MERGVHACRQCGESLAGRLTGAHECSERRRSEAGRRECVSANEAMLLAIPRSLRDLARREDEAYQRRRLQARIDESPPDRLGAVLKRLGDRLGRDRPGKPVLTGLDHNREAA